MRYKPKFRLDGHTDSVIAMEFSPNGLFLASAGVDGKLFVWSSDDGKCLQEVTQNSAGFSSLVWLDNERILAGKEDGKALLVISSLASYTVHLFPLHAKPIESLACRGGVIASGAHGDVFIFAISNKKRIQVKRRICCDFNNENMPTIVTSLHWIDSFSPSALLVTYLHHGVMIWNTETSESLSRIQLPTRVGDASISPDHRLIIISNLSTGFDVYDLETKRKVKTCLNENSLISGKLCLPVSFINGGRYFMVGSSIGRLAIWSLSEDTPVDHLIHKGKPMILSIAETYNILSGRTFVACGTVGRDQDSFIQVWQGDVDLAPATFTINLRPRLFLTICVLVAIAGWLLRSRIAADTYLISRWLGPTE